MNEVNSLLPQQSGAPLAIAGDWLAWRNTVQGAIELWSVSGRKLVTRVPVTEGSVAFGVVDGVIVAAVGDAPAERGGARLIRFSSAEPEIIRAEADYYFSHADRLISAGDGELWVSGSGGEVARYRVPPKASAGKRVERLQALHFQRGEQHTFCAAAEPGRVVYYESGAIVRLTSGGAAEKFPVTAELANPTHLAAGPTRGTVWATSSDTLQLVALRRDGTARVMMHMSPGDEIFHHLASAGELAFVLTVGMSVGKWGRATLVAVAESGEVRWRTPVQVPPVTAGSHASPDAWIAASADYVGLVLGGSVSVYGVRDGILQGTLIDGLP